MFVLCLLPVVELGFFKLKFYKVEFAIAEMACVSRNIRTAVPAVYGIPVQRSISGRDVSHPVVEFEKAETEDFLALSARLSKSLTAKLEPSSSLNAFSHILILEWSLTFIFVS